MTIHHTFGSSESSRFKRILVIGSELRNAHLLLAYAASENLLSSLVSFHERVRSPEYEVAFVLVTDQYRDEAIDKIREMKDLKVPVVPVSTNPMPGGLALSQMKSKIRDFVEAITSGEMSLASSAEMRQVKLGVPASSDAKSVERVNGHKETQIATANSV